jgi:hypothetical protein
MAVSVRRWGGQLSVRDRRRKVNAPEDDADAPGPAPVFYRAPRGTACGGDELGDRVAQLDRVVLGEVDLILASVEAEVDGLGCLATVEIVDESGLHLLCHPWLPVVVVVGIGE